MRQFLVKKGPVQIDNFAFPVNNKGRQFSLSLYNRKLANGEHVAQSWLIYSQSQDSDKNRFEMLEHFLGFITVVDTSGKGLTEKILKELEDNQIPIEDMRGQGYDNYANMKRKRLGVQSRILQLNPRSVFVPCACHSLNLVVNNAASASSEIASSSSSPSR
ncbi:zinc finger MYM-type protein 1-like [Hydra vulgaris]|uniref:zinc finger MYM-type protein 1-like n=1 Tax=Hydra vulgaris TaxID=6087 RepID=UPI0032EA2569